VTDRHTYIQTDMQTESTTKNNRLLYSLGAESINSGQRKVTYNERKQNAPLSMSFYMCLVYTTSTVYLVASFIYAYIYFTAFCIAPLPYLA